MRPSPCYEATGENGYLAVAERLANAAQAAFGDSHGGFFTTAAGAVDVPLGRPRSATDNATPSGNGMMAEVLGRLFHLDGRGVGGRARMRRSGHSVASRISCLACRRCWRPRICLRKVPAW